ncbi:MAG: ABC transporter ATP-binding protein [Bacteroidetes bacterium HGW-Bacteroidetes-21]|jgi:putative ABC transport system ATP-binding protein|nr:MAG: ABC transporter ATP-binding protein [Bacteroidetes bacterium HGW-Bacteroidetes-21]
MKYIELKNLTKDYKTGNNVFSALKNVDLTLNKGTFTVIKGASGSGKSTLLNLISGIDSPTSGEILINGTDIKKLNSEQLAKWRGTEIGIVFQFFQLMPTLTVLENVILPMEFVKKIPRSLHKERAIMLLNKFNIATLAKKYPHTLSGGEKQRVAIARALANDPSILIADEPTGNLDSTNTAIIHQIFELLNIDGKTILYVTHEQGFPRGYSQVVNISDGAIASVVKKEMEVQHV